MIAFLRGILFERETETVMIDVGGIGYTVYMHKRDFLEMPDVGKEIFLYTYLQVMENEFRLYGFLHREELELFKKLLMVSGLGAKSAMGILGATDTATFYQAVINENEKFLTKLPGIGKKTAQRLIFELKEKLKGLKMSLPEEGSSQKINELVEVLEALGYKTNEVYPLIREMYNDNKLEGSVEENLKLVLRALAAKFK